MTEDEKLYAEAMSRIDKLVEEVFELCDEVAEENHFEREWVLECFRQKFNQAKRKNI